MKKIYYQKEVLKGKKHTTKKIIGGMLLSSFVIAVALVELPPQTVLASMYGKHYKKIMFNEPQNFMHHNNTRYNPPHIFQRLLQPNINSTSNNNKNSNTNLNTNNINVENNNDITVGTPMQETASIQPEVVTLPAAPVVQQVQPITQLPQTGVPLSAIATIALLPVGFLLRKWAI